jgi:hypothetical protein
LLPAAIAKLKLACETRGGISVYFFGAECTIKMRAFSVACKLSASTSNPKTRFWGFYV